MIRMLALAWRGLIHEPMHLLCNVMIVCGALTPLLVLQGVKSGVYSSLIADLESNPNLLLVSTLGDRSFAKDDVEVVRNWPETNFAVLRTRGIADTVTVQALSDGPVRQASAVPTAPGDPALPNNLDMADNEVALTALLAETTGVTAGDAVRIVARSEARPAPLVMEATVATVVPRDRMTGISVLIDLERLDDIEAYYDGYALPQHGLDDGRDASERIPEFEGLRLYARTMTDVAALERRIGERFGVSTRSDAAAIERTLALGRNLDRAFLLIAIMAATGLVSALGFGFWAEAQRERRTLAAFALVGFAPGRIASLPFIKAFLTCLIALLVAFGLYFLVAEVAEALFAGQMRDDRRLVRLTMADGALAVGLTLFCVGLSSIIAARVALKTDPAIVFRD